MLYSERWLDASTPPIAAVRADDPTLIPRPEEGSGAMGGRLRVVRRAEALGPVGRAPPGREALTVPHRLEGSSCTSP
jgi:hypothetical protein